MASSQWFSHQSNAAGVTFFLSTGLAAAAGQQHEAASPLCLLLSAVGKHAVGLLVDLAPAVWQVFEACLFGSHWSSFSVVPLLMTAWHLLGLVLGSA